MTDFHTHCFPDALAPKVIPQLAATANAIPAHDGTAAGLLALQKNAGITRSVVMPVVTNPAQFDSINRFAVTLDRTPGLRSFGGIHPDCPEPEEKLAFLKSQGLRGIKIHPDYQDTYIDDPRYLRILRAAMELGLFVMTHAGIDPVCPDTVHCTPDRVLRLLDAAGVSRCDHCRPLLILAHLGGVGMQKEFTEKLSGAPVYIDTSFVLPSLPPSEAASLIRAHGVEKTLFGTDSPWGEPPAFLAALDRLPLTSAEKDAILSENAAALLD